MASTGRYIETRMGGERVRAFVPKPLPAGFPGELAVEDAARLEAADLAVGRLDSIATLLPDPSLFIYFYVRKEAVLSSQIEGTQSSLSDLILYESDEAPGVPLGDVEEVSRYVAAMNHGLTRLREDGFPLSLRLFKEIHGELLAGGRGSDKEPGAFRRSQNWLGGSRPGNASFVPPPPHLVVECMGELESFLHDRRTGMPILIKAALAHVQFETIHPFLDGNGRLGRLLITLLLCSEGALQAPLLYLSLYFKQHRDAYYDHLQRVRTEGAWLPWLRFFLDGVAETANQVVATSRSILSLFAEDEEKIGGLGPRAGSGYRVHAYFKQHPISGIPAAARTTQLSQPTVTSVVTAFEELGILTETTGRPRDRIYVYTPYMRLLADGPDHPPADPSSRDT